VLQGKGVFAKDLATPSGKRPYRGCVIGSDRFEILGRSQQLLRDLVLLAPLLQQDAQ
jgi:hypothetical protein